MNFMQINLEKVKIEQGRKNFVRRIFIPTTFDFQCFNLLILITSKLFLRQVSCHQPNKTAKLSFSVSLMIYGYRFDKYFFKENNVDFGIC